MLLHPHTVIRRSLMLAAAAAAVLMASGCASQQAAAPRGKAPQVSASFAASDSLGRQIFEDAAQPVVPSTIMTSVDIHEEMPW